MKTLLITSILFISTVSFAKEVDRNFEPELKVGQCSANIYSKKYVEAKETPSMLYYTCDYKCLDNNGQTHIVKAENSVDRHRDMHDGSASVCEGAIMVQERMPNGNTFWNVKGVRPIWAAASSMSEMKVWIRTNKVQMPSADYEAMKTNFYGAMVKVGTEFSRNGKYLLLLSDAAEMCLEIATQTEKGKKLLEEILAELSVRPTAPAGGLTARNLVVNAVLTHGRFLIK